MKASELLADARDQISMDWVQNSYRTETGGVCMLGALDRVVMNNINNGGIQAHKAAKSALEAKAMEIYDSPVIPYVNDASGRTKQDVLDLMDKCVIGLEEVGS